MRTMLVALALGFLVACGVVGPPIAPEDVGVARTIAEQKKREAAQDNAVASPVDVQPQGQDVNLPPLRPVGTR